MRRSRLVLVLAAVVALVLVAGCSSGGGKKAEPPAPAKPDAAGNRPAVLTAGKVSVQSYGPEVALPKNTAKAIVADTQAYVDAAMTAPYNTGKLSPKYPALFDAGVRDTAAGRDVGVLTDAPVGKTKFTASATPVSIYALADGSGQFVYLATRFTYVANLTTDTGRIKVERNVELTFAPSGKQWIVTAYRARMTRKLPSGATTTTSVAGSSRSTP